MKLTAAQLAERLGGTLRGDGARVLEGAAGLAEAGERDVSFLANPKYADQLKSTKAGAVILAADAPAEGPTAILVKNPHAAWGQVLALLEQERLKHPTGVHPTAVVDPSAKIGARVSIGAYTVIEAGSVVGDNTVIYPQVYIGRDVRIGRDGLIYPRVVVRERVVIGDRCVFQPGVVIGGDGYGFAFDQGRHVKVPQIGTVEIGDDVELQANTTVDRGAVGPTKIGKGTKVDNLVQVAHGAEVGDHCLLVAQVGVAGSTKLGHHVVLAAQVGVAGHLTIGDMARAGAKAGITKDVAPKEEVWGVPAQPLREELKTIAAARKLPQVLEDLKAIKKKLGL